MIEHAELFIQSYVHARQILENVRGNDELDPGLFDEQAHEAALEAAWYSVS